MLSVAAHALHRRRVRAHYVQHDCRVVFHHAIRVGSSVLSVHPAGNGSTHSCKELLRAFCDTQSNRFITEFCFQLPSFVPAFFVAICAFLIIVPCYVAPYEVFMGMLITLVGIPVYYVGVVWKNKPQWFSAAIGKYSLNTQHARYSHIYN